MINKYMEMKLIAQSPDYSLYHGDARNLNLIPDRSIDLVIIDAPYGIEYISHHRKLKPKEMIIGDDKAISILRESFWEIKRVMKENSSLYLFTRWDMYPRVLELCDSFFDVRNVLLWIKNNWGMGNLKGSYATCDEWIIYAVKGNPELRGGRDHNVLLFKEVPSVKLIHPAQKPVGLLQYLIYKSSKPGDTVLDCFMGSGSSIVSAVSLGRYGIGIDIDEKYVRIAKARLEQITMPLGDLEIEPEGEIVWK